MGFVDYPTILTIFHLLGVALGVGGAFASDLMFFSSVKDEKVTHTEMRFLRLGSTMVWSGLLLLIVSGGLLFLINPSFYANSAKFLAKMTIVGVVLINGIFFHGMHLPRLIRHVGTHFPSSDEFVRKFPLLLASGAISVTSWISALILGVLRNVPYGYLTIIGVYVLIIVIAIGVAAKLKGRILSLNKKRN